MARDNRWLVDVAPAPPAVHNVLVKAGLYTIAELREYAADLGVSLADALGIVPGITPTVAAQIAFAVEGQPAP